MYGLKQAAVLAYQILVVLLEPHGYNCDIMILDITHHKLSGYLLARFQYYYCTGSLNR